MREIEKAEILDRIDVLEIKGKLQTSLEFTEMPCYIMRDITALLSGDAKIIETILMQKDKENAEFWPGTLIRQGLLPRGRVGNGKQGQQG